MLINNPQSLQRLLRRKTRMGLSHHRRQRMHQNRPHLHQGVLPSRQCPIRTKSIRRGPLHHQTGPGHRTRQRPTPKATTSHQGQTIGGQTCRIFGTFNLCRSPSVRGALLQSQPGHSKRSGRSSNTINLHHEGISNGQIQHIAGSKGKTFE